ncbi:signal peptidase I [Sulfurospirillum deleyianum]|uniref:Signal peptidase I n=1 Tax=Sulfurospirillum deleyianum (strain ATCC 51133 / DSM 6946 / 5175) TaxID=525898 RepID=D1B1A5_SULD5|nr:signal peptidase I [Sulfurospirillum deleyianum]ACZ11875.1 signal peptidase I [Sulfurospirillum deleyianum DSM 6946]
MKNLLNRFYHFSNSWTGTLIIVLFVIFFIAQAFVIPSGSMKRTLLIGDHLFVKKFSYGIPTPHLPWLEIPVLPDFNNNGHLIEGERPKRGDIVVFRYPKDEKIHYVKRCVATENDEILYQEKNLYIHFSEGDEYIKANYPANKIVTIAGKLWVNNPYMEKFHGIGYDESIALFEQMKLHLGANQLAMKPALVEELPSLSGQSFNAFYTKVEKDNFFMMGDNRDHSNDSRFWGSVPYSLIVGKPWFIYFSWDDDYVIRWNRIGRFIDSMQYDEQFFQ